MSCRLLYNRLAPKSNNSTVSDGHEEDSLRAETDHLCPPPVKAVGAELINSTPSSSPSSENVNRTPFVISQFYFHTYSTVPVIY